MNRLTALAIVSELLSVTVVWAQPTNVFPASGNVGIGTTTPSALLNTYNGGFVLDNDGNYSPIMARTSQNNVNANCSASIIAATGGCTIASPCEMNTAYGSYFGSYSFRANTNLPAPLGGMFAQISQSHTPSSRPVSVYFSTTPVGSTYAIERMRIDPSGNVGIGTSTPGTMLSVVSPGSIDGLTLSSVNRSSVWFTTTGAYNRNWLLQSAVSSNTDFQFLASTTVGGAPTYSVMTLLANGNVGIGTTSPVHPLQVAGAIGAEEVIVSATGADYVFDPGYRLAPLSEVAAYINEHHHLPDIPSASEMHQNGAGVGEMQSKLLAKIEELTLHMIQAEERNNRLEQQNHDLQERITRLESQGSQTATH